MPVVPAIPLIRKALGSGYAVPALNVANMETVQGVLGAAGESASPVMLQISPGAIAYAGYETIRGLAFDAARRAATPVVVHLDHCRDPQMVRRAIGDGFGSVMFDGSQLAYAENVRLTRDLADEAHAAGIAIEGELGYIGGSEDSSLEQARAEIIDAEQAADFVNATGVDVLAPAIGSLHRMPDDSVELEIEVIRSIALACRRPLALHGGSGIKRAQLSQAITAGIAKVNVSSQVGRALARGIQQAWQANPDEHDLRRYLAAGREEVRRIARDYIELCGSSGRAETGPSAPAVASDTLSEPE